MLKQLLRGELFELLIHIVDSKLITITLLLTKKTALLNSIGILFKTSINKIRKSMSKRQNQKQAPFYKSYGKLLAICINASLSAFFVGYSLVYMGSIGRDDFEHVILRDYDFLTWELEYSSAYRSIVQGVLPVGAIIGALLSSQIIRLFSRRMGFLVTNLPAFLAIVLMVYVKNPYTFLLARLIQGICTGIFSAIVPLYINEIVTPDCTNLGSLNQIFVSFGQLFSFLLAYILSKVCNVNRQLAVPTCWKIMAEFPLLLILIQTFVFIFVFPYQTPKYLSSKGEHQKVAQLISVLYCEDHVQTIMRRFKDVQIISEESSQRYIHVETAKNEKPLKKYANTTSKTAIFFAIHLSLLQQMSGINSIGVYRKNTIEQVIGTGPDKVDAIGMATLALSAGSFIAALLTIKLMNFRGRKFLIQFGTAICCICLGVLAVAFLLKGAKDYEESKVETTAIIVAMCIFMTVFGFSLGPIVWLYIPQIVQPNIIPYSTMTNLGGATLNIIVFPLVPRNGQGYVFVFFFAWCLFSLFVNQHLMVQTKTKPREQVFEEYHTKNLC